MADRPAAADVAEALEAMRRGTKIRLDALRDGRVSARTGAQVATIVGAALADTPPADLPAVLSSVEDVARVCEAAGLRAIGNDRWVDEDSGVSAAGHIGRVAVAASGWLAALDFGAPASLLWSAIQAARGGEPRG